MVQTSGLLYHCGMEAPELPRPFLRSPRWWIGSAQYAAFGLGLYFALMSRYRLVGVTVDLVVR